MEETMNQPAATDTTVKPTFPNELINGVEQSSPAANIEGLGPLKHLLGTWTNKDLANGKGGTTSPFSFNLMPLPSTNIPEGYLLKNFKYYEEITFSAIHGTAPNRGGDYSQVCNTIFYEQRVFFADGPAKDQLVHAENGTWLFLVTGEQLAGPYGTEKIPNPNVPPQNPLVNVVKQISVPHGNSILAQGGIDGFPDSVKKTGPLTIPDYPVSALPALPEEQLKPYSTPGDGNLYPALNNNPNGPIQDGVAAGPCAQYIHWNVDTNNSAAKGAVTNIPFEQSKAKVIEYSANYWLQALTADGPFTQLSYNQTIQMDIPIKVNGETKTVSFPHVTCNTLTKK